MPNKELSCPAAVPYWDDAVLFGVVCGTPEERRVVYLAEPIPVTPQFLDEIKQATAPATIRETTRMSATCHQNHCPHWTTDGAGRCTLAATVLRTFDPVTERLPDCSIRKSCVWWHQEGRAACIRCPQIATDIGELPDDTSQEFAVADAYLKDPRHFKQEKLRTPALKAPRHGE
jgi:hypothetical protein